MWVLFELYWMEERLSVLEAEHESIKNHLLHAILQGNGSTDTCPWLEFENDSGH